MNAMTKGFLALMAGWMLACGNAVEPETPAPELARQEQGMCAVCGDGLCDPSAETPFNCPQDCRGFPTCGDSVCCDGESPSSCPQDCPYASDLCYVTPQWFARSASAGLCAVCGDGLCDPSSENASSCPVDCGSTGGYCGDNYCDPASESAFNCPQDCRGFPTCGDSVCCDGESPSSCSQDCPYASDICYVTPQW